jgi:hypothetical protein
VLQPFILPFQVQLWTELIPKYLQNFWNRKETHACKTFLNYNLFYNLPRVRCSWTVAKLQWLKEAWICLLNAWNLLFCCSRSKGNLFQNSSPCYLHFLLPKICFMAPRIPLILQKFSIQNNREAMKLFWWENAAFPLMLGLDNMLNWKLWSYLVILNRFLYSCNA